MNLFHPASARGLNFLLLSFLILIPLIVRSHRYGAPPFEYALEEPEGSL